MPADCLALAVRVGCQDQAVRLLCRIGDFLEPALLVAVQFPVHREVFIRTDAAILGRQIADMAIGCEDLEVLAQIVLDGFRLRWRLYDDKLHETVCLSL